MAKIKKIFYSGLVITTLFASLVGSSNVELLKNNSLRAFSQVLNLTVSSAQAANNKENKDNTKSKESKEINNTKEIADNIPQIKEAESLDNNPHDLNLKLINSYESEIKRIATIIEQLKAGSNASSNAPLIDSYTLASQNLTNAISFLKQLQQLNNSFDKLPEELESIKKEIKKTQNDIDNYVAKDYSKSSIDEIQLAVNNIIEQSNANATQLNNLKNFNNPSLSATLQTNRTRITELKAKVNSEDTGEAKKELANSEIAMLEAQNLLINRKNNTAQSFTNIVEARKELYNLRAIYYSKIDADLKVAYTKASVREQEKLKSKHPAVLKEVKLNQDLLVSFNNYSSESNNLETILARKKEQFEVSKTVSQTIDSQISLLKGTLELNRLIAEQKNFLPDISNNLQLSKQIITWRVDSFQYLSLLQQIKDPKAYIAKIAAKAETPFSKVDTDNMYKILEQRNKLLNDNITALSNVIATATDIDAVEVQIESIVNNINNKLNQQDFFVRSTPSVTWNWIKNFHYGVRTQFEGIISQLTLRVGDIKNYVIGIVLIIIGFITRNQRKRIIARLAKLQSRVNNRKKDGPFVTPLAIILTALTDIDKPLQIGGLTLIAINCIFLDNTYIVDYFYYSFVFLMFFTFANNLLRRRGIINTHFSPLGSFYANLSNNDDAYEQTTFHAPQPRVKAQPTKIFAGSRAVHLMTGNFIQARLDYLHRVELNKGVEPKNEDHTLYVPKVLKKVLESEARRSVTTEADLDRARKETLLRAKEALQNAKDLAYKNAKEQVESRLYESNHNESQGVDFSKVMEKDLSKELAHDLDPNKQSQTNTLIISNNNNLTTKVTQESTIDPELEQEINLLASQDSSYLSALFNVKEAEKAILIAHIQKQPQPKVKQDPSIHNFFYPKKAEKKNTVSIKTPYEVEHKWYSSTPKERVRMIADEEEYSNFSDTEADKYINLPNAPVKNQFIEKALNSEDIRIMLGRVKWMIFALVNVMYFNIHPGVTPSENIVGQVLYLVTTFIIFLVMIHFSRQTMRKRRESSGIVDIKTKVALFTIVLIPLVAFVMVFNGYVNTVTILFQHGLFTFYTLIILMLFSCLMQREFALFALNSSERATPKGKEAENFDKYENIHLREIAKNRAIFLHRKKEYFANFPSFSKLASVITGLMTVLMIYDVWSDLMSVVTYLDNVTIWNVEDSVPGTFKSITLLNLLKSIVTIVVTWLIYKNLKHLLDIFIFSKISMSEGLPYAIETIITYLVIGVGFAISFSSMGLSWSKLQWLFAALSVGLGFGLQEIFANFVSGIIILFERPIRIGDFVTINGTNGEIKKIQIRATTLLDPDNKEVIIPNKTFVTGQFTNWSLSTASTRLVFNLGVAYDTDVDLATATFLEAASMSPKVLSEPAISCYLLEIGASTYNFVLRVYVGAMADRMVTFHDIYRNIIRLCAERKIELAFNQLDVFVKDGSGLDVKLDSTKVAPIYAQQKPTPQVEEKKIIVEKETPKPTKDHKSLANKKKENPNPHLKDANPKFLKKVENKNGKIGTSIKGKKVSEIDAAAMDEDL